MRLMMRMDLANMHLFRMNHQQRNRCIEVAMQYYRLHLPDFPELRSLDVLQELWT
jgi:DNA repair protein RecO (recombination protein O)